MPNTGGKKKDLLFHKESCFIQLIAAQAKATAGDDLKMSVVHVHDGEQV